MSKRQTRRAFSVRGDTYWRLRALAERLGRTATSLVQEALDALLAAHAEAPPPPSTRRPRPMTAEERTPRPGPGNVRSF